MADRKGSECCYRIARLIEAVLPSLSKRTPYRMEVLTARDTLKVLRLAKEGAMMRRPSTRRNP